MRDEIAATGVPVVFHNINAADDEQTREATVAAIKALFDERRAAGADPVIAAFLHSLAFGADPPLHRHGAAPQDAEPQAARDDGRRHGPLAALLGP